MGMKKGEKKPSQTYMFEMETPETDNNPLVLKEPAPAQMQAASDMLNQYTKADLVAICSVIAPVLKQHSSVRLQKASGETVPAQTLAAIVKTSSPKQDVIDALATILAMPENLRFYTDTLSEEMRQLWRLVLVRIYLPLDEVRKILNTHDKLSSRESQNSHYFYNTHGMWNRKELNWFTISVPSRLPCGVTSSP